MTERYRLIANALLFQLAWFSCVLGAQQPWLLLLGVACIAIHLRWISRQPGEWRALLLVALCGWLLDSLLMHLGVFGFNSAHWILPLWLALLWLAFASTLGYSLNWSANPWWLGSLLGALGGPLSYWGGAKLAGVQMPLGLWPTLLLLALIWAALLPALHALARRRR